eukprot:437823-Amphidinium_carterae.1
MILGSNCCNDGQQANSTRRCSSCNRFSPGNSMSANYLSNHQKNISNKGISAPAALRHFDDPLVET